MVMPFMKYYPGGNAMPTFFKEKLNYNEKAHPFPQLVCDVNSQGDQVCEFLMKKIHTIRLDESNRWKPGMKVDGFYNTRTKNMERIFTGKCVSIQRIVFSLERINSVSELQIKNNKSGIPIIKKKHTQIIKPIILVEKRNGWFKKLDKFDVVTLMHNDGINDFKFFFNFFQQDTAYKIIHFTDYWY